MSNRDAEKKYSLRTHEEEMILFETMVIRGMDWRIHGEFTKNYEQLLNTIKSWNDYLVRLNELYPGNTKECERVDDIIFNLERIKETVDFFNDPNYLNNAELLPYMICRLASNECFRSLVPHAFEYHRF
jgi:hypothetical protein